MSHRRIYAPWLEQWKVWTDDIFLYKKKARELRKWCSMKNGLVPPSLKMTLVWQPTLVNELQQLRILGFLLGNSERLKEWDYFEGHGHSGDFFVGHHQKRCPRFSQRDLEKFSWLVEWRTAGQHTAVWCHPLGLLHLGGNRYGFLETRRWVQVGLKWPIERLDLHPKECFERCIVTCAESLFYELSGAGNIPHKGNPLEQRHLHIMGMFD